VLFLFLFYLPRAVPSGGALTLDKRLVCCQAEATLLEVEQSDARPNFGTENQETCLHCTLHLLPLAHPPPAASENQEQAGS
jgi:hypothetical protein